jgi:tetratricopeptide (TPR) repeat protein
MGLFDNTDTELHRKGIQLRDSGSIDEGMKMIRQAAENGAPNALGTLIWYQIKSDQLDQAIKDFESCLPKVHEWNKKEIDRVSKSWLASKNDRQTFANFCYYELSNAKSNAAVAYLGKGNEAKAMELWNEAATDHGHVEARFYPIFHMCQANPTMAIGILKSAFNKQELQRLVNDMVEVSTQGTGWFANWAKNGLDVLKQTVQKGGSAAAGKAAASGAAAFIASKNVRNFINNQMEENSDGAESIGDWLQDLF